MPLVPCLGSWLNSDEEAEQISIVLSILNEKRRQPEGTDLGIEIKGKGKNEEEGKFDKWKGQHRC